MPKALIQLRYLVFGVIGYLTAFLLLSAIAGPSVVSAFSFGLITAFILCALWNLVWPLFYQHKALETIPDAYAISVSTKQSSALKQIEEETWVHIVYYFVS